ncbi:MAG: L,D-transpeptidase family protein [Chloroflexia bacterium]|nr:L,D-transpeptidase family protein [Chloroflexia bacterium]
MKLLNRARPSRVPTPFFIRALLGLVLLSSILPAGLASAQEQGGVLPSGENPVGVVEGAAVIPAAEPAPVVEAAPIEQVVDVAPAPEAVAYTMNPSPMAPPLSAPAPAPAPVAVPVVEWSPPSTVYIPETGHSVDGVFLDVWRAWGGALSWGNPITAELTEDGRIVQYYSFGRFEYWPEDPNGEVVKFGAIGAETRPYLIRRGLPGAASQVSDADSIARAWMPLDPATVPPDSAGWRFIPATGHGVADDFKAFWEATGEAAYLGNPVTEQFELGGITYQVFERGKVARQPGGYPYVLPAGDHAASRRQLDRSPVGQGTLPIYSEALFIPPPPPTPTPAPVVAAAEPAGVTVDPNAERWVQVSISQQYLWARQGDVVLWEGFISTGKDGFNTPTGTFFINRKLPVEDMAGVIGGESYNVPEVPDVMYFTDVGHALHGTYWHNNFGVPMSHGCINLPMDVADWMYEWINLGAQVEIMP